MTKKQLIIATAIAGFSTMGISGLALASSSAKPAPLAQELAQKFNLKQSDVQTVIDHHHSEVHSYREQSQGIKYEERLNAEVKAGKLTSTQKDQILAKHNEFVTFMNSLKDKTPAERHAAMKQKYTEVQQWAKSNNIDPKYLGFGPMGHDMERDHSNNNDTSERKHHNN